VILTVPHGAARLVRNIIHHPMRIFLILSIALAALFYPEEQGYGIDLSKKDDLLALGTGRIIEKDNTIIKKITLAAVNEYWIEYIKDNSLHDKLMEQIIRIEFPQSKWGAVKIEFPDNKPSISRLN